MGLLGNGGAWVLRGEDREILGNGDGTRRADIPGGSGAGEEGFEDFLRGYRVFCLNQNFQNFKISRIEAWL